MSPFRLGVLTAIPLPLMFVFAAVGAACSSSSSAPLDFDSGVGGPVTGALDDHCKGVDPIVVNPASCHPPAGAGGAEADAGAVDDAAAEPPAPVLYNSEGDDDDCKYHVKFEVTPVAVNANATFRLTVTKLAAPGGPATGAIGSSGDGVAIEAYLASNESHVAPNTTPRTKPTETPAGSGVYTIAPVKFDQSGRWVVRFHLYETCEDNLDDSPHGHAAFFVDVP